MVTDIQDGGEEKLLDVLIGALLRGWQIQAADDKRARRVVKIWIHSFEVSSHMAEKNGIWFPGSSQDWLQVFSIDWLIDWLIARRVVKNKIHSFEVSSHMAGKKRNLIPR